MLTRLKFAAIAGAVGLLLGSAAAAVLHKPEEAFPYYLVVAFSATSSRSFVAEVRKPPFAPFARKLCYPQNVPTPNSGVGGRKIMRVGRFSDPDHAARHPRTLRYRNVSSRE